MKKNNSTKKEITIDDLALMVAKGFDDMNGRIDQMDGKIDQMDGKMDSGFKSVNERLDRVEVKLENIEADLHKKVDKIDHNTLTYRVEKLEKNFA